MAKNHHHTGQIADLLRQQPEHLPAPQVKTRLLAEIHRGRYPIGMKPAQWIAGVAVTFLTALLLWLVIQPGVVFSWESDQPFVYYQIYRAPVGQEEYLPVSEKQPALRGTEYRFIDSLVVPGQSYQYLVEGTTQEGHTVYRQAFTASTISVLFAHLAILASSLIITVGWVLLVNTRQPGTVKNASS